MRNFGDPSYEQELQRIIRVDHAGEYGAKRIYDGQILGMRLRGDDRSLKIISHMKDQEDKHFDYFNEAVIDNRVRPTIMQPIWNVAGFGLGLVTALMGKKAAMACTVAVEEVIDQHYQKQLNKLANWDDYKGSINKEELSKKIEEFRQEEIEHRDIGLDNEAEDLSFYKPLTFIIKKASQIAIAISSRI